MATERDAIEAKQNRWRRYVEQLKAELAQAEEVIHALELAKGEPGNMRALPTTTTPTIERVREAAPTGERKTNVGMTDLIRRYIRDHVNENEKIDVPTLARWLQQQGMGGPYRTIYNTAVMALRKDAERKLGVEYEKGVGFSKPVREDGSKQQLIRGLVS